MAARGENSVRRRVNRSSGNAKPGRASADADATVREVGGGNDDDDEAEVEAGGEVGTDAEAEAGAEAVAEAGDEVGAEASSGSSPPFS